MSATPRSPARRAGHGEQMATEPEQRGFAFDGASGVQDGLSPLLGLPPVGEVSEPAGESLQSHQLDHIEGSRLDLCAELPGLVEVRGGEPVLALFGIAVLPLGQIPFDDGSKGRVEEKFPGQSVEQGSEPADGGCGYQARGPYHPPCLGNGLHPFGPLGEVIERTEEEDGVEGVVLALQVPGIADLSGDAPRAQLSPDHLDMSRREVDDVDAVPGLCQPGCVDAGGTTHVQQVGRRRR